MENNPTNLKEQLLSLENKLSELIDMADRLKVENESLRAQQGNLVEERSRLIEKNDLAKSKVEAIITRLKSLESA
ncbi:TIGR02449 family protein [Chromatiales bacterium (ex Bugula neritina AB1)]|nr:TIGR02449 family protein [Chromatiales bacterium (ex Bugula neritina AB1)]